MNDPRFGPPGHDYAQALGTIMRELGALNTKVDRVEVKVDQVENLARKVIDDRIEDKAKNDRRAIRLRDVEREVERISEKLPGQNWKKDPNADTGVHDVTALEQYVRDRRDSGIFWSRQKRLWLAAIVISVISGSILGCLGFVASEVKESRRELEQIKQQRSAEARAAEGKKGTP